MIHGIIVPSAIKDACNQAAHTLGIDPEGLMTTLCVPLVPADGPDAAEPTHWAARGSINETARVWLAENVAAFPGAMWWRWTFDDRELVASYDEEHIGETWSFGKCLQMAELKRRQVPL